jgi:Zn-dependent M32 family carboxypeptidase
MCDPWDKKTEMIQQGVLIMAHETVATTTLEAPRVALSDQEVKPVAENAQTQAKEKNVQRLAINLLEGDMQSLKDLSQTLNLNITETVRRTLAVTRYLVKEARKEDRTVTIRKADGTFVDIFI